jgi:DNA-binding MarR family transcriptional regulator
LPSNKESPLKASIGFRIHQVHDVMHTAFLEKLSAYGLSATEWAILNLCADGAGTAETLESELRVERPTVLRATEHLLREGLLLRASHAEESRYSKFVLSDKGRAVLPKLLAVSRRLNRHFLAEFSQEQREQLLGLLTSLAESKPFRRARTRQVLAKAGCPNCPIRHLYS